MNRASRCLFGLTLISAAPAFADLPRQAGLGVSLEALQPSGASPGGVAVGGIVDPANAAAIKLQVGDRLRSIDGQAVATVAEVVTAVARRAAGDPAVIKVERDGRPLTLSGKYAPRPLESYKNGSARYGAVPFRGGELRDILLSPAKGAQGPVVFLLQGYTCASVEATRPTSSHRQLFDGLLARGISVYRIEKPHAGDSRGGPACVEIDFETELAAFEAGYRTLMERDRIQPERIFLIGHSLGGVEAPLVAARNPPPRGVAIFGAVARGWADYMLDVVKYQPFLSRGADPAKAEIDGEQLRGIIHRIYSRGEAPGAVAASSQESSKLLRAWLGWDGKDQLFGRHYRFWQQLSATPLLSAWRDTRSDVLAVYGESDFAAIDDEDHKLIADVVNHYRPGTARYVQVPRTGHGMTIDGTPAEARRPVQQSAQGPEPQFNVDLIALFGDWIEATMRQPIVAERFPHPATPQ